jgi:uncharacterized protein Yka (UPF0111/DUF47 family)
MFTPAEREEITDLVHQELAIIAQLSHIAGSYSYQCRLSGQTMFTHHPVGTVLHVIPHF